MFIIKFNNMVKNKWVWAAFALVVAVAFGASDIIGASRRDEGRRGSSVGSLAGKPVDPQLFDVVTRAMRFEARSRDEVEVSPREVWKAIAALAKADELGIRVSDRMLASVIRRDPSFRGDDGAFDDRVYRFVLRQNNLSPVMFQEIVRTQIRLELLRRTVCAGPWAQPSVVEDRVRGLSDTYTLVGATLTNSFAEADAAVSPEEAQSYYDSHQEAYSVPERRRVAYVTFPALKWRDAGLKPEEDDVFDWYDSHQNNFVTKDTNGVESVKPLEDVRQEIETLLSRQMEREEAYRAACAFADWFLDNESATEADFAVKAAEAGMTVSTSAFFARGSAPISPTLATDFSDAVFSLGGETVQERVSDAIGGDTPESLVAMLLAVDDAHVTPYAEVSEKVLADAKAQKAAADFQKAVADVQGRLSEGKALGQEFEAVCRELGMEPGTNVVFSYLQADSGDAPVPSPRRVAQAMTQLGAGDICLEPIPVPGGVWFFKVVAREPDETGILSVVRNRVAEGMAEETAENLWREWQEKNLESMSPVPAVPFDEAGAAADGDDDWAD